MKFTLLASATCILFSSLLVAEPRTSFSGEHVYSTFSELTPEDSFDFHKVQGSMSGDFSQEWEWQTTLSVENGFNQRYPSDMVHLDDTDIIVEQALVSWQFAKNHNLKIGRFYLPIGRLNGPSEIFAQYGAERNPVEINIIPTNWVETGLAVSGRIVDGLFYDAAVHSAIRMVDPGLVRDGRRPGSFSISKAHAFTFRFQYRGIENLLLSSSIHFEVDTTQWVGWGNNSAIMIQTHADYQYEKWGFIAFYSYWDIDGYRFETSGREKQNGWYLETNYRASQSLGFFTRLNEWDNEQDNQIDSRIRQWDAGINWWLNENVIIKFDIGKLSGAGEGNRFSAGLAWNW